MDRDGIRRAEGWSTTLEICNCKASSHKYLSGKLEPQTAPPCSHSETSGSAAYWSSGQTRWTHKEYSILHKARKNRRLQCQELIISIPTSRCTVKRHYRSGASFSPIWRSSTRPTISSDIYCQRGSHAAWENIHSKINFLMDLPIC